MEADSAKAAAIRAVVPAPAVPPAPRDNTSSVSRVSLATRVVANCTDVTPARGGGVVATCSLRLRRGVAL